MKLRFSTTIALLFFMCNVTKSQTLYEHYRSASPNFSEKVKYLFQGKRHYAVGSEIHLYKDHTYKYYTCGNIMTGSWKRIGDKVSLTILTNRYRIDSLHATRPKLHTGNDLMIFQISKKYLTQIRAGKDYKTVEILENYDEQTKSVTIKN